MAVFFAVIGILCLAYYVVVVVYTGFQSAFSMFWLVLGILCILGTLEVRSRFWFPEWNRMLLWVRVCVSTTVAAGVVIFLITEGFIVSQMVAEPPENLDYIVLSGAGVGGNQSETDQEKCLDAALGYLEENPGTQVIVSGGVSEYEHLTYAQIMGAWLVTKGIEPERIIYENHANSIQENIGYSEAMIEEEDATIGVVTMNYHTFRAKMIAAKEGVSVHTIPASQGYVLILNNMVYEFFAVMKDKLVGNI